jgi:hypothetical protein
MTELFLSDYMGGWKPTSKTLSTLILDAVSQDRGNIFRPPKDDAFCVTYHPDGIGHSLNTAKVIASHVSGKGTNGLGVVQLEDPSDKVGWYAILKIPNSEEVVAIHNPDQNGMNWQRDMFVWRTTGSPEYATDDSELVQSTLNAFRERGIPIIKTRGSLLSTDFQTTLKEIFPPKEKRRRR